MRPRLLLLLIALLAAGSLGLRCARNTERAALDEPITPPGTVEREPYLIAMTDSSAVIRWSTFQPAEPGIRFWSGPDTTELVLTQRGREHSFAMSNLQPGTTYTYQIQINDTLWSESADFTTFPVVGAKDPFTYLILGDSGTLSAGQLALAEKFNQEEAALVLHTGDMAYQDGRAIDFTVKVFGVYAPLFKRVPIFPSPG
ncbi:MAG: fibronectin type III domain-containing protein [Gemmatimonadota bacterium]